MDSDNSIPSSSDKKRKFRVLNEKILKSVNSGNTETLMDDMREIDTQNNDLGDIFNNEKYLSELDQSDNISQTSSLKQKKDEKEKNSLSQKKRLYSDIWNHFDKETDGIYCKHCPKPKTATGKRKIFSRKTALSNLKYHLKNSHPSVNYNDKEYPTDNDSMSNNKNQSLITEFTTQRQSVTLKTKEEFRDDIIKLLVGTNNPANLLESKIFQGFFQKYLPMFNLPCRRKDNDIVKELFDKKSHEIREFIKKNPYKFSFTFDGWTAITGDHLFGVTSICISNNNNIKIKNILLFL